MNKLDASRPGERSGWLASDVAGAGGAGGSIAELLRAERESAPGDLDRRIVANVSGGRANALRGSRSGADEADMGADDDLAALADDKTSRLTSREAQRRDMQRAVAAHQRSQRATAACWACLEGGGGLSRKKHCIVALGEHSALLYPPDGPLLPGHMLIVPLPHVAAMTDADEEVREGCRAWRVACGMWRVAIAVGGA